MKLINELGEVIAQSDAIAYDEQMRGWMAGGTLYSDPDRKCKLIPTKFSPVEFMLLFTSTERVAIKARRATDPVIDDWLDIIEDSRLTEVDLALQSTQDALAYLVSLDILTDERKGEILGGEIQ